MSGILFTVWIAFFPFVMLYGAYEGPKTIWLLIGGFFLTAFWTVKLFLLHPLKVSSGGKWFLIWLVMLGIASVIGIHPVDSVLGGSYRHQGVLFFFTLLLLSETLRYVSVRHQHLLSVMLGFASAAESIIILEQKILGWSSRPSGTIGEPNAAGGFLCLGLWWIYSWPGLPKYLRFLLYIVMLAGVAATGSRTAIGAAILFTGAILVGQMVRKRIHAVWFAVLTGALLTAGIYGYVQYRTISIIRPPSPYENRMLYWQLGVGEFMKRPILGYGAETEEVIFDSAFQLKGIRLVDFTVDRSHNVFLDVALWSGFAGLAVFVMWLVAAGTKIYLKKEYMRLAAFASWIVFAFFQPVGVVQWVGLILLTNL